VRATAAGFVLCACLAAAACGRGAHEAPAVSTPAAAAVPAPPATGAIPHGDHNPHYGGIVLMNGDLHFEIVADRKGFYRLYFSDATRNELPAATATGVALTVSKKAQQPPSETVTMRIDDTGEFWSGRGGPVDDPAASLHISYTAYGKPYFIDVPFPR
jgi:hypothetical protein